MTRSEQAAYDAGVAAADVGEPFRSNAYPLGTAQSRAWSRGHRSEMN